jgi:23S rRNA (guanosine2251-2'-O)-methyltransferase
VSSRRVPAAARPPRAPRPQPLGGEQVEGYQAVRELLAAGCRKVHKVVLASPPAPRSTLGGLAAMARARQVPVEVVGPERLRRLARTDAPQGVVALAEGVPDASLQSLAEAAGPEPPLLVILDEVTDPGNLGAVMRSSLAAGASGLVLPPHRGARLTPAAIKAAAGAAEHLPVAVAPVPGALSILSRLGIWTVGLDPGAQLPLWDLEIAESAVALVLGAEGSGLGRLVRDRCDLLVRVPMRGPLQSLNVAATAALACFEVARRRGG